MKFIRPFDYPHNNLNLGGKANRLMQLYASNVEVPFGGTLIPGSFQNFLNENPFLESCIASFKEKPDATKSEQLKEAFDQAIFPEILGKEIEAFFRVLTKKGYKSVAVRSSGNLEDGVSSSFAGQFESYLNVVDAESVKKSVIDCWASLYGNKVVAYSGNNQINLNDIALSVIIQGQIASESSGVIFTANPLTGNDKQMVIEAVTGVGEALVQGAVMPDMYHYNWYDEKVEVIRTGEQEKALVVSDSGSGLSWRENSSKQRILTDAQVSELGKVCLEVQQFYGEPLDIEWAFQGETCYILQARPLTSIHFDVEYEWTTADLKDGGISSSITTPMMFSLYEYIFENTLPVYLKSIHVFPKRKFNKWFNWWFGYAYWNMLAAKEGVKQIPGFKERSFDMDLGIDPDYQGDGYVTGFTPASIFRGIKILIATNRSIARRPGLCRISVEKSARLFKEIESMNLKEIELEPLMAFAHKMFCDNYLQIEGDYFFTIYDNSNAATLCKEAIEKINKNKNNKINYLNLVCGLSDLSHMRPTNELWDLSRLIRADKKAFDFFISETKEGLSGKFLSGKAFPYNREVNNFIQKFKFHSMRELDLTIPNWDEDPSLVFDMLLSFLKNDDAADPRIANQKQVALYESEKRKLKPGMLKKVEAQRQLLWWREEMRDYSSRMYYYIRKVLLAIGEKLTAKGMLEQQDDVFFLTFQKLFEYTDASKIAAFKKKITKNKIFYKSYRNFNKPSEIWEKKRAASSIAAVAGVKDAFLGISGSSGTIKGKAKVIHTIFEADLITDGDILVTKFTDPAWTPYFSKISGLVTETGGMLSHGAVVSREYGIPAVLGVKNATASIQTGDIIEIDGSAGVVKIAVHS